MAERPGQVGQLPTAGREAPPRPCGGRRRSRAGLLPCLGPGGGQLQVYGPLAGLTPRGRG